jgi:hypothetical protein
MSQASSHSLLKQMRARCAGVAIDVDLSSGAPLYVVMILRDGETRGRTVAMSLDEAGARRAWDVLARILNVPRYVALPEGGYRRVAITIGSLAKTPAYPRRGRRLALRRRPAARRRLAAPIAPARYGNEREIIARN